MTLRERITRQVNSSIQRPNEYVLLCNQYVQKIFKECGENIDELGMTTTFLPLGTIKPVDFTFSCTVDENFIFPKLIPGDVVVFYSNFSGDNISHVMIAIDEDTLVGTNNGSTYGVNHSRLCLIDVRNNKLAPNILVVRSLAPEELVRYHANIML